MILVLACLAVASFGQAQTGLASWYGQPFHGRRTASGETFDMNQLTGAHRTYPFGTLVRVTLLATGRSVVVRINDRGPFVENRLIDLSRAAAQQIGLLPLGVGRVQIEVVGGPEAVQQPAQQPEETPITSPRAVIPAEPAPQRTPPAVMTTGGGVQPVFLQLIALSNRQRAIQYARELSGLLNLAPQVRQEGGLFRVFLQVEERDLAHVETRLTQAGYRDWQTRRRPIPGLDVTID